MHLVVASSHELLVRVHCPHGEARARNVGIRHGNAAVGASEVVGGGPGRVLLEGVELVILTLELILVEVAQRLAIRTGLVCAAMSGSNVSVVQTWPTAGVAYWARLSEREKALLHSGQTYGRSCVWVRTCLSARSSASISIYK